MIERPLLATAATSTATSKILKPSPLADHSITANETSDSNYDSLARSPVDSTLSLGELQFIKNEDLMLAAMRDTLQQLKISVAKADGNSSLQLDVIAKSSDTTLETSAEVLSPLPQTPADDKTAVAELDETPSSLSPHTLLSSSSNFPPARKLARVQEYLDDNRILDAYTLLQRWLGQYKARLDKQDFASLIYRWSALDDHVLTLIAADMAANGVSPGVVETLPTADATTAESPSPPAVLTPPAQDHADPLAAHTRAATTGGMLSSSLAPSAAISHSPSHTSQAPSAISRATSGTGTMNRFSSPVSAATTTATDHSTASNDTSHLRPWKHRQSQSTAAPFDLLLVASPGPVASSTATTANASTTTGIEQRHWTSLVTIANEERAKKHETALSHAMSPGPLTLRRKMAMENTGGMSTTGKHPLLSITLDSASQESLPEVKRADASNHNHDHHHGHPLVHIPVSAELTDCMCFNLFKQSLKLQIPLTFGAYFALAKALADRAEYQEALGVLSEMPEDMWTIEVFKFLIYLYVTKRPKDLAAASKLLQQFVPERPEERAVLWLYHTSLVRQAKWADCIERFEETKSNAAPVSSSAAIPLENAIMEVALTYGEYAYGWQVFEKMKQIDRHSPLIVMTICWKAFFHSPQLSGVGEDDKVQKQQHRSLWEARAWACYGRANKVLDAHSKESTTK
eukprot:Partr_v1_DN28129_c0_g1_i2_m55983